MDVRARMLVIDDQALVRRLLQQVAEALNMAFTGAESGLEGLRAAHIHPPDLVLLDLHLPDLSGVEVCRRLKHLPRMRDVPVLFLSSEESAEEKVAAFAAGAADYITKPFVDPELRARISHHLDFHRQRAALARSQEELQSALRSADQLNRMLFESNERLRLSEQRKSHFISNIRSEFNNPLTGIIALADQLAGGVHDPGQVRALALPLRNEALDLDFQIHNIVCAAELEAGELSPSPSRVEVEALLEDVVANRSHQAEARAVTVVPLVLAPGGIPPIGLDGAKLHLILVNLLANAIAFSPEGGSVEASLRLAPDGLLIVVRDHGPGIPLDQQRAIFEHFRQLEEGSTRSHRGHGLGLSVVRALAELLDGWVKVDSSPGMGATFSCFLPALPLPDHDLEETSDGNLFFFEDGEAH